MIAISQVRTDGGTQSRAAINAATVTEYAEAMADPATVFPPIIVYFDGSEYWLADGFHRLEAWRQLGRSEVPAEIRQGDRRKAILHSVAANSAHGLRRTNDDKRRAVLTLLEDAEWSHWSDRQIAEQCRVTHPFVGRLRASLTGNVSSEKPEPVRTYTTKHGTEAQMNTAAIGGSKADQETQPVVKKAEQPAITAAAPPVDQEKPDPERRAVAKLTTEAMIDEILGLRADLAEQKAKRKLAEAERDTLKDRLKAFEVDDIGRSLGQALRTIDTVKGRMTEYQATAARAERRAQMLEKDLEETRRRLEAQEVPY